MNTNNINLYMTTVQFVQIFVIAGFIILSVLIIQYALHYYNTAEACAKDKPVPKSENYMNATLGFILSIFIIAMFASSFQIYESGTKTKTMGILLICVIVVIGLGWYLHKFNNIKKSFDKKIIGNPMDVFK